MERIEYSNNYHNKKKKNSSGLKYLVIILVITLSFLIGAGVMYIYSYANPKIITKDRVISQNTVTEEAMEDAIDKSIQLNPVVVWLSPAFASFDMFSGYEERGKVFKEYVLSRIG